MLAGLDAGSDDNDANDALAVLDDNDANDNVCRCSDKMERPETRLVHPLASPSPFLIRPRPTYTKVTDSFVLTFGFKDITGAVWNLYSLHILKDFFASMARMVVSLLHPLPLITTVLPKSVTVGDRSALGRTGRPQT